MCGVTEAETTIQDVMIRSHNYFRERDEPVLLKTNFQDLIIFMADAKDNKYQGDWAFTGLEHLVKIVPTAPKDVILKDFKHYLDKVYKGLNADHNCATTNPFFTTGKINTSYYKDVLDAYVNNYSEVLRDEAIEKTMHSNKSTSVSYDKAARTFANRVKAATKFIVQAENGTFPEAKERKPPNPKSKKTNPDEPTEFSKVAKFIEKKLQDKTERAFPTITMNLCPIKSTVN